MARQILIPLDGSALADGVIPHVERLVAQEPCDVLLVRVVSPAEGEELPGQADQERAAAAQHLQNVQRRLADRGAAVSTTLREGDPAAEILALIDQLQPDLVAMSSHGRSGVTRWLRGSVAERVLRNSEAPVLLVTARVEGTHPGARIRRVLVPLDGTRRAAQVLPLVEDFAKLHEAEVILARIEWEGLSRPLLAATLAPERVVESIHPWRDQLADHGVDVRAIAAQGDSASQILDLAEREDVDLIAMTSHGRTGLTRLVEGSVSEKVLRHCRRPLLVLPTREEPES
jgi:nucleotide-binding universal stress UspA family protein